MPLGRWISTLELLDLLLRFTSQKTPKLYVLDQVSLSSSPRQPSPVPIRTIWHTKSKPGMEQSTTTKCTQILRHKCPKHRWWRELSHWTPGISTTILKMSLLPFWFANKIRKQAGEVLTPYLTRKWNSSRQVLFEVVLHGQPDTFFSDVHSQRPFPRYLYSTTSFVSIVWLQKCKGRYKLWQFPTRL
jgi:hypothetical protein